VTHRIRLSEYALYDSMSECATAAAVIFKEQGWRWAEGIPDREDILACLNALESWRLKTKAPWTETGRLLCYEGKFGHERPSI